MPDSFQELLAELESYRLEVSLTPARSPRHESHCVRVATGQNPTWYRRLCAAHPSSRRRTKFDTRVRRGNIANILARLAAGQSSRSRYTAALIREAARRESCPF